MHGEDTKARSTRRGISSGLTDRQAATDLAAEELLGWRQAAAANVRDLGPQAALGAAGANSNAASCCTFSPFEPRRADPLHQVPLKKDECDENCSVH